MRHARIINRPGRLRSRRQHHLAISAYFAGVFTSTALYDEAVKRLEQAGAGAPPGREYHAAFTEENGKIAVFDVCESQEALEAFAKTLMPTPGGDGRRPANAEHRADPQHHQGLAALRRRRCGFAGLD